MSFIEREDIYNLIEGVLKRILESRARHGYSDAVQTHHV